MKPRPLRCADRGEWQRLARAYKDFYATPLAPGDLDAAWQRLQAGTAVRGLVLAEGERLVGLVHFLFHASTWGESVCYLQDLFVDPQARGQGRGRALIEAVAEAARRAGAQRLYWLTQAHNLPARALYERLAEHRGFIRYDYPIAAARRA